MKKKLPKAKPRINNRSKEKTYYEYKKEQSAYNNWFSDFLKRVIEILSRDRIAFVLSSYK